MRSSVALLLLLAVGCLQQGSAQPVERTAGFIKGQVKTTRRIALPAGDGIQRHQAARVLLAAPSDEDVGIWVLGLPVKQQRTVAKALDAQLLYALPGKNHHWLVRASTASIQSVLDQFPSVTAAPYPDSYKLSPAVDAIAAVYASLPVDKYPKERSQLPVTVQPFVRGTQGDNMLAVLLAMTPRMQPHVLTQLVKKLPSTAAPLLSPGCDLVATAASAGLMAVVVCLQDAVAVAQLLAAQPECTWVDAEQQRVLYDLNAIATTQAPQLTTAAFPGPTVADGLSSPISAQAFPFWAAGVDGTGQVVGVVDSGLDMDSCYVWDPEFVDYQSGNNTFDVFTNTDPSQLSNARVFVSDTHRKVAMYVFKVDSIDDRESHGTHVSTSIVGAPYGVDKVTYTPDHATGMAPGARVAMFDVGKDVGGDSGALIFVDRDLPAMYNTLLQGGAYVTTNSWGYNAGFEYVSPVCELIDGVAWDHPDTLHVFAAGNNGSSLDYLDRNGTVGMPASCKNVLGVGATENYVFRGLVAVADLRAPDGSMVPLAADQFLGPTAQGFLSFKALTAERVLSSEEGQYVIVQGYDSSWIRMQGEELPVVLAQPVDACTPLLPATFPPGVTRAAVVFQRTDTCSLGVALGNALSANGAAAVLFYYNTNALTDQLAVQGVSTSMAIPTAAMGPGMGMWITQYATRGVPITVTWLPPDASSPAPMEHVAEFSGYGASSAFDPSRQGDLYQRLKPDLVAPGYIMAAKSDGSYSGQMDSCSTMVMMGTSMAAPQVSGAAILARQYFLQGFYPLGTANPSTAFTPSGALLKAVLIAGTVAMQGVSRASGEPLAPPPSPFQGFGRLDLARSLPLPGNAVGWNLQVLDRVNMSDVGETHTYTFTVDPGADVSAPRPLVVVMTYYDAPGYVAGRSSVVNNLDVQLDGPLNGTNATVSQTYFPNGLSGPDSDNNVEKIFVPAPAPGTYQLTVRATYLFVDVSQQPYSVVVLGSINSTIDSPFNPGQAVAITTAPPVTAPAPGGSVLSPADSGTTGTGGGAGGPTDIAPSATATPPGVRLAAPPTPGFDRLPGGPNAGAMARVWWPGTLVASVGAAAVLLLMSLQLG